MTNHSDRANPAKVTIETLFELKRSERPAPEFWERFERELRAKQLAAIVAKRPWWVSWGLPQAARRISRLQVPLGAAAVLAAGFLIVREYRPSPVISPDAAATTIVAMASDAHPQILVPSKLASVERSTAVADTKVQDRGRDLPALVNIPDKLGSDLRGLVVDVKANMDRPAVSVSSGGLTEMIPWAAPAVSRAEQPRSTALGELPNVHFASALLMGREPRFDGRVEVEPVVMPAHVATVNEKTVAEEPASLLSPREVRRNRILSSLAVADIAADAERSRMGQVREVLASTLDDDRLYDSVRRLGMGGDRLTLKF